MEQSAKKTLLLHACCGPCSSACLERLFPEYDITVFYYNPNITDAAEYALREKELAGFLACWQPEGRDTGIGLLSGRYDPEEYYSCIRGLEQEPEGGERCYRCYKLRMEETARTAAEQGFDAFDTTLSISPYKRSRWIEEIGRALAQQYGPEYLAGNYKKQDGYRRSIELSKEYGLYRQDYCGCEFSKAEAEQRRAARQAAQDAQGTQSDKETRL